VLLAGGSSRAMLASARFSCFLFWATLNCVVYQLSFLAVV